MEQTPSVHYVCLSWPSSFLSVSLYKAFSGFGGGFAPVPLSLLLCVLKGHTCSVLLSPSAGSGSSACWGLLSAGGR